MLSAVWSRSEPHRIAQDLADVVCRSVGGAFVYVRLSYTIDGAPTTVICTPRGGPSAEQSETLTHAIRPLLDRGAFEAPSSIPNPVGPGVIQLAVTPIGLDSESGVIITGSASEDFPTAAERLLLDVAANQAAVVLQHARMNEALRHSETRFRTMADNAPALLWVTDATGSCTYLSKQWYEFTGRTPERDLGIGWLETVHPDDVQHATEVFAEAHARHVPFSIDYRLRRRDGEYRWAVDSGLPRLDGRKQFQGFVGAVIDVHDRKLAEDDRRHLVERLKEADRHKDEFLATLAHELRNPLAPVRNAAELLRRADGRKEVIEQAVTILERQLSHMVRLIDDLMDVARITTGKFELRKTRVELSTVLMNAVEASRPLIESHGHELTLTWPPMLFIEADAVRLTQVFANILNNAARYTDPGGRIWLSAERDGADVAVRIKDTGVGVPPEMMSHVFEMFTQVDRSLERSRGGLGLGLTLVKRLTELHGGTVRATSKGPGHGSEFVVHLPIALGPGREDATALGESATAVRPLRIIVVDDNVDGAESLAILLRLQGHDVQVAHDGPEALRVAESARPDVMVLDIGLPGLNGYDVARRIRQQAWSSQLVVIAVSGWGQHTDKQRSVDAGIDYHLVKPVNPADLERVLAENRISSRQSPRDQAWRP